MFLFLGEFFEDIGIKFTKIKSDGSEWFYNDQPATRNFTRVAKSSEVYSNAIFLGQSSLLKSVREIETIGTDQVYAEIDLERIVFPKTVPSQVNFYYKEMCFRLLIQGFLIIALDPLETINDIDRLDNFFIQLIKFTDEEIIKGPYVDWIPIGKFMNIKELTSLSANFKLVTHTTQSPIHPKLLALMIKREENASN